jgi:hypothetical protein
MVKDGQKSKGRIMEGPGKTGFPIRLPKRKVVVFSAIVICCSILTALALCEWVLRYRDRSGQGSDLLDPGLIRYDKTLGWKLTPRWQGNHRHRDFLASYQTNRYGFRGEFPRLGDHDGRRVAFLGDSFTFGFGVNDHETFVHRLNEKATGDQYLNFAVPGYSTDQQYLLLRRRVINFRPDVVALVTYLGNDLFDNLLPFPLQASHGKPYFEFSGNRLLLKNSPVSTAVKSKEQASLDLHHVVTGESLQRPGGFFGLFQKMKLFQMAKRIFHSDHKDLFPLFDARFQPALKMYGALLDQMVSLCQRNHSELIVILMPGRSLVERPGSRSAQFQEYLREKIIEQCKRRHIRLMDLALHLKTVHMETGKKLYFPNDGHMNALGHGVTADYIRDRFKMFGKSPMKIVK